MVVVVLGIAQGGHRRIGVAHEGRGRHEPRAAARVAEREARLVRGDVALEDHRGDRPDRVRTVRHEVRVRSDDVEVEATELGEPVRSAASGRLVAGLVLVTAWRQ